MTIREIAVTVDEDTWVPLRVAADCAGMSVQDYVSWAVRVLAIQSQPGGGTRRGGPIRPRVARRRGKAADDAESAAWTETFAERLSHRAEQFRAAD
ncbi:hypothetical protein [Nocardia jejuensis]|uniref:hypothetical protein n=1 Tax=Nocardia jejuensis TaxID=328049 RepID=UPI000833921B|nr:hypothetical protein [Nocardia jejuensis]